MECLALQENSSQGQFWANATHFLLCCNDLVYPLHLFLSLELQAKRPNFTMFWEHVDHDLLTALLEVKL